MAPKKGMQGFVKQKNTQQDVRNTGSPSANHDFDDLKRPVPNASARNSRKHRTKQSGPGHHGPDQSGGQSHFHDDASSTSNNSSADALSTTASTSRQRFSRGEPLQAHQHIAADSDHPSAAFGGTNYTESLNDGYDVLFQQELPLVGDGQLDLERKFQGWAAESRADKTGPTIAQTPIKGDSYPPTSTGAPSLTDQREQNEIMTPGYHQYGPIQGLERGTIPERTQNPQVTTSGGRRQQMPDRNMRVQPPATSHQLRKRGTFDSDPQGADPDVAAGFAFPPGKKEVALHSSHGQLPNVGQQLFAAKDKAAAPHPHKTPGQYSAQQAVRQTSVHPVPLEGLGPLLGQPQHRGEAHHQKNERNRSVEHTQMTKKASLSEEYMEEDPREQADGDEVHGNFLDYDQSELFEKDLQSLQSEPFDHSTRTQSFVIADLSDSANLADKVAQIARAEQKTQVDFFDSLNVDEWEEAGDWFLERFGETLQRLKDVRRAKRKAALAFEEEIEKREKAVDKQKAMTTAALDEMKTSGLAVLQGTPKKQK